MISGNRTLGDVIRGYLTARTKNVEQQYIGDLVAKMNEEIKMNNLQQTAGILQQAIYLNLIGVDTKFAYIPAVNVMSMEAFSEKRMGYTAAEMFLTAKKDAGVDRDADDAVLMATQRVQKDLTSIISLNVSIALTSVTSFLSAGLAHQIASDVIALMTAAKPVIRQKAIMTFYHVCLKYPDALRPGFVTLKSRLDDSDASVVFSALTIMSELCAHNVQNFVGLIPKFHKMLEQSTSNWVSLRLITILRMLSTIEPRLPKKLIGPFTTILETTTSITVLFECVRTIIDIPITNPILLTYATQRMQAFLEHQDTNLRFLCLTLFIKLIEIQPRLVAQHKELITQCLDSTDEPTRLLALDLLAALANSKTIDGIVAKMFDHFRNSKTVVFKDQLMRRVIQICSKNDYDLISDFDWYISVLMDFVEEGGFTCYTQLAEQYNDMASRVPACRPRLVKVMASLLDKIEYKDAIDLLMVAISIISEYAEDASQFDHLLQNSMLNTNERVQAYCIATAFKLYLKADSQSAFQELEKKFRTRLPFFANSRHAEVQDRATTTLALIDLLKQSQETDVFITIKDKLTAEKSEAFEPLEKPPDLDGYIDLFEEEDVDETEKDAITENDLLNSINPKKEKTTADGQQKPRMKLRHQKQGAKKPEIIKKNTEKAAIAPKPKVTESIISAELAKVDLTEVIAEEEIAALPKPQPYQQSELYKNRPPPTASKSSHSGRHHRHKHRGEKEAPPPPTVVTPPPTKPENLAPKPRTRIQKLGYNSAIDVKAIEFSCDPENPNKLEIEFALQNLSGTEISAIDVTLNDGTNDLPVLSVSNPINYGETIYPKITIDVKNNVAPHKVRLIFIPKGAGETLETFLWIFPSFFLYPANPQSPEVINQCDQQENWTAQLLDAKPKDVLQCLINVLRAKIISGDKTKMTLYSRSTAGLDVFCEIQIDMKNYVVNIKSQSESLTKVLIREIKMKLDSKGQ